MIVVSECIRLPPCELVPPWHLLLHEWCASTHALTCTIFFDQAAPRVENWEGETWEEDKEKQASKGKEGVCHPFPERKHDILVITTHYPEVFKGFEAWGCLRGVLGLFWHPAAHDMTAVLPKPVPVTFWYMCWDWQWLRGPWWTTVQTWGQTDSFHKHLRTREHVKEDVGRQTKACKTIVRERMGFHLLTEVCQSLPSLLQKMDLTCVRCWGLGVTLPQ